ncbi:hypothetical protein FG147_02445 [Thauera sp. UPWRP]|nr:hypothetical protein FG147_02445 [Thauera sp. UPWRP]
MGDCIYCGKPAGFFRKKHPECQRASDERIQAQEEQARANEARERAAEAVLMPRLKQIIADDASGDAGAVLQEVADAHQIDARRLRPAAIRACEEAISAAMEDGLLTEQEERGIIRLMSALDVSRHNLSDGDAWGRLVKLATLRDIMSGTISDRITVPDGLPVNFRKGERMVWAFPGCDYLEDRSRTTYVGGSQGISVRIMSGVYYRVGAFKGERISKTERVHVDTGWVVITDQNVYFAGPKKSVRLPYEKIVSFLPFSDGIGVMKDTATAKPQIFVTGDGWFTYNLVSNLAAR